MEDALAQEEFSFPVACMLVVRYGATGEKRVLIQRRRKPGTAYDGLWEIPQGRIRRGESFLDAARRELREETHLTPAALDASHGRVATKIIDSSIESFSPFMCVTDSEHNYVGIGVIVSVSASADPAASEEADGHCWAGRDEVADLIKAGRVFPLNVPLLQSYFGCEQTGTAET